LSKGYKKRKDDYVVINNSNSNSNSNVNVGNVNVGDIHVSISITGCDDYEEDPKKRINPTTGRTYELDEILRKYYHNQWFKIG